MPHTFTVSLQTHAECVIEVEADSVEAAIAAAESESYQRLCNECSHELELGDDWKAVSADRDGELVWSSDGQ
ncbi:Uncharacterised protein (plasmid) [Tsukamurella tyrosinosolvens]|uniref:Uncharacterized protein n=1 Tax=Tsukamurella tyrosinosolvens TaxID=57704 RepID=A0A1H4U804_TSUTY|nr:hypothetical protein [Tsukamurella tyrosinosolvens]KXO92999.1 hypothetical protein AXK58_14105 [Tsukamurella tyrosinosolvens]SEC64912.1 hypothetical protein SAMN04489793_2811 [Tsukamurella tyrosinosolvens]VEH94051.1 Uncharacterised protein [Tsukamurella tyrosinosolvens]